MQASGKGPKKTGPELATTSPVSNLHDFVAANRLPPPNFRFARVEWSTLWVCSVMLGDKEVGGTPMAKKPQAKGEACKAALEYLMET
jgi:hypothetical protein